MPSRNQTVLFAGVLIAGLVIGFFIGSSGQTVSEDQKRANQPQQAVDIENPHAMHDAMQSMTAGLAGKTGDAFDKAFIDEMIVHHEGAVEMAKQVLAVSQRPELRTLAEAIIEAQTAEIRMMQEWGKSWFGRE